MKFDFFEEMQEGKLIDSEMLFLVWYILDESKKKKKSPSSYGKGFVCPNLSVLSFSWRIPEPTIVSMLKKLTSKSYIKHFYIEGYRLNERTDKWELAGKQHFTPAMIKTPKSPKELLEEERNIKDDFDIAYRVGDVSFSFHMLPDIPKLEAFIQQYLDNWRHNRIISPHGNLLSANSQIEKLTEKLSELLRDYPSNLLFNWMYVEGLDFMATLLFLNSRQYFVIENFQLIPVKDDLGQHNELSFRIVVNDSFSKDFQKKDNALKVLSDTSKASHLHQQIDNLDTLIFTKDGKLLYSDFDPIFNLSNHERLLCAEIFSKEKDFLHKTIDVEDAVYGDISQKDNRENLKKLIQRFNKRMVREFSIPEAIHFGINIIRRLV